MIGNRSAIIAELSLQQVLPTDRIATVIGIIIPQVSTAEPRAVIMVIIPPMSTLLTARALNMNRIVAHSISIILIAPLVLL